MPRIEESLLQKIQYGVSLLSTTKEFSMRITTGIATITATAFLGCAISLFAVTASADSEVEPKAEKSADSEEKTVRTKSGLE